MARVAWRKAPGVLSGRLAAVVLAALLLPGSALANQCAYSDGKNDDGPCIEVRNELKSVGRETMNLWCHNGPTARSHKIVLRDWGHVDSFTCRGVRGADGVASTTVTIQRTQIGCDYCEFTRHCLGKLVLSLVRKKDGSEALVALNCSIP